MPNNSVPISKLDTEQSNFLDKCLFSGKNYWISGFPGSGKSTILEHCVRLIKADRPQASILVVVFTRSLIEMFRAAFKEMNIGMVNIMTMYEFMRSSTKYDYILCDEVQDLTTRIIEELRRRTSVLITAGDENQSIFQIDPTYKEFTVDPKQITNIISGETYSLTIVHRLSPAIQRAVQNLIPALGNLARLTNRADHTTQIRLCHANDPTQEVEYIYKESQKAPKIGKTSAILIPNHEAVITFIQEVLKLQNQEPWPIELNQYNKIDYGKMNEYLKKKGIKIQYVGNKYGSLTIPNTVYVMTYHSAKGLDFDNVFLPGIDNRLFITSSPDLSKRVFMVAMTRSRNELFICHTGMPHPYVNSFSANPTDCIKVDISNVLKPSTNGPIGF